MIDEDPAAEELSAYQPLEYPPRSWHAGPAVSEMEATGIAYFRLLRHASRAPALSTIAIPRELTIASKEEQGTKEDCPRGGRTVHATHCTSIVAHPHRLQGGLRDLRYFGPGWECHRARRSLPLWVSSAGVSPM